MFEITLEGPGKNALGTAMMEHLLQKLSEAAGRPVLVTGAGDAFSAGLNLKEVAAADSAAMDRFLGLLDRLMSTWFSYPAPTVALVNGHAIAGGCILALTCDWRVAPRDPKIRIGLNEVALGLRFPPSILSLTRRRVPPAHLETVVLGAGLHDPAASLHLGLLDEVSDDPRGSATQKLAALAAHPPAAYAAAKKDIRGSIASSPEEERRFREEGLAAWTSPDLKARLLKVLAR